MAEVLSDHGLWLSLPGTKSKKRNTWIFPALCMALGVILLLTIPSAKQGTEALCNELFDASEAVNQYAYSHFSVSPETKTVFAAILLVIIGFCWMGIVFLYPSRLPALLTALILSAAQAYFGLSMPIWALIPMYAALAFRMTHGIRLQNVGVFILVTL